jgi:hypothetical protein
MAVANAGIKNDDNRDPRRLRIHVLVAGDPSLAKSTMIKKASNLLPNGRFESAIGSSGIGLTFTVTKEANESYVLRLGAIPLASGSICAINEMNQTPLEQQKHYFDFMEEGQSTSGKYAIPARIVGHTTIIGSANPRQGRWKDQDSDKIQLDEISILPQVMDRFDIICILRQGQPNEQKDWEYIKRKNQIRRDIKARAYDGYDEHLKKYLMYARTFNPDADISEDALNMLDEYWVKMGQAETDDRGRPRKLEGLYRIAVAISKLKLKNQVDVEDAIETMQHYNVVLLHFSHLVPVSQSPKEVTRETCIDILREYPYPIAFTPDLISTACERKEQIKAYLGEDLHMRNNWKLREVYEELLYNDHVILVQEKPVVLKWKGKEEERVKANKQACDVCDPCEEAGDKGQYDAVKRGIGQDNENKGLSPSPSHTSYTSHSPAFSDSEIEQKIISELKDVHGRSQHPPQASPVTLGENQLQCPECGKRATMQYDRDKNGYVQGVRYLHSDYTCNGKLLTTQEALVKMGCHNMRAEMSNPYEHLIETEDMPTLGKTAYRCKEHPKIWDTDLEGLIVGHFVPFHTGNEENEETRKV